MTAAPSSPSSPRSREAVKLIAFVGDDTGAAPTALTDAARWLLPIDFAYVSGGSQFNTLSFQIDLDTLESRYQDILVPIGVDRTVELREVRNGNVDHLVAWAKLATNAVTVNGQQESSTVTCRLDPTALKLQPIGYGVYWDTPAASAVNVARSLVFNPLEETLVWGNRSNLLDDYGAHCFLEHGTVRSQPSLDLQTQSPKRWTLAEAVHRVCWLCNTTEALLTNPQLTDLQAVLDDLGRDAQFRNREIPLGSTLFEALDLILLPYSCSWRLKWKGELGSVETSIEVFELGDGVEQPVRIQRLNDTMDASKTDVSDLQMNFDITAQPNRIRAVSALKQLEITLKLFPAWHPDHDPLAESEYYDGWDKMARDPDYQPDGIYGHVGRKFTANEAGDYNGFRTSQAVQQTIAGTTRLIRRPLLPCLTRGRSGHLIGNNGYYLEWKDFDDVWHLVEDGFEVLDNEAGIVFTGMPPVDVWNQFESDRENFYLRLTATVELDDREEYETPRRDDSPQGQDHWLYLPLDHVFSEKRLNDAGDQVSRFYADRKFDLVSADVDATTGDWTLTLNADPKDVLTVGQKLAVLDSTRERIYTVKELVGAAVKVHEDADVIDGSTATGALVFVNTDAEGCTEQMKSFAERARDDNDFALVTPTIQLHGIDHREYEIGKLVPDAQPRNVSFAGRRGNIRPPQIVGVQYEFQNRQRTTLQLEQMRKV